MKKTLTPLSITILMLISINTFAQKYKDYLDSAELKFSQEKYFDAYEFYKAAKVYGKNIPAVVKQSEEGIDKSIVAIKRQKEIADAALKKAEEMQTKVETAMFDKAVKERFPEWKGFENYFDERTEILEKIDSLDLSDNALLRIPKEVTKCPNLKHINLLGNDNIDWNTSTETLSKLSSDVGIYVSVYDLDSISYEYWNLVTGIEIINNYYLTKISENILQQKQLTYLDLSSCGIDTLTSEIENLTYLTSLNLYGNKLTELPKEIGNLTSLTRLNLNENQLTELPKEIGNLNSLSSLGLGNNQLTELPIELGNLNNLKFLNLSNNKITSLPKEFGKLRKLEMLDLFNNDTINLVSVINAFKDFTNEICISNDTKYYFPSVGILIIYLPQLIKIPEEIGKLKNLRTLSLVNNQLTSLPAEIKNCEKLNYLNLRGNNFSNEEKAKIEAWFENNFFVECQITW